MTGISKKESLKKSSLEAQWKGFQKNPPLSRFVIKVKDGEPKKCIPWSTLTGNLVNSYSLKARGKCSLWRVQPSYSSQAA